MNQVNVTTSERTLVVVKPGTLVQYENVGIFINCNFNDPEFDSQPYVTVNTDDLPDEHNVGDSGIPAISVHLNDATLYDTDRRTGKDTAPGAVNSEQLAEVMRKLRKAHVEAQGKGDQGAFDVWNAVERILSTNTQVVSD